MNPLNYGTQPVCKKLHDAGIVLETDFCRDLFVNPERTCQLAVDWWRTVTKEKKGE
jgi:hypothetical protein